MDLYRFLHEVQEKSGLTAAVQQTWSELVRTLVRTSPTFDEEVFHLLGQVALQTGQAGTALEFADAALVLEPLSERALKLREEVRSADRKR